MLQLKSKRILLVLIVLFIAGGALIYIRSISNDAQHKALFLNPYVKSQHLIKLSSFAETPGFGSDVSSPGYGVYYKTAQSTQAIKDSLKNYLQSHGFWAKEILYTPSCSDSSCSDGTRPVNGGKPYWAINAGSNRLLVVATITDKSYLDTSLGEKQNPAGYNILYLHFQEPGTNPGWY